MRECIGCMREEYVKLEDYNRTALIEVGIGELEPL